MSYCASRLGFTYGLKEASFALTAPGFVAIAGPNGAGKSTLVSMLAGIRPYRGSCTFAGKELRAWARREFARRVTFLPQSMQVDFPFTTEEVILMGRTPHAKGWYDSPDDLAAVDRAMSVTATLAFRQRDFRTLSGGERQRVMLAAALAQQPDVLLLDEPATFLDLRHQLTMHRLLRDLSRQLLVIAVTHDLNFALRYADRVLLLDQGVIAADGPPAEALSADVIGRVFGVTATLHASGLFAYDS